MAGLVDYSSSSAEDEPPTPPAKKRKLSTASESKTTRKLPPLPSAFLDQYSSTVRTADQDDPSLHGGRKRVTPHVQGNWPAHIYLEWHPNATEANVLADVVSAVQDHSIKVDKAKETAMHDNGRASNDRRVHSLLANDLGVALPLHISLSRPLILKTEQKDAFLSRLRKAITESNIKAFDVQPKDLAWHSNENSTRWFLVLRLQRSADEEMCRLLNVCNDIANEFAQPLLYVNKDRRDKVHAAPGVAEKFHVSVAWSLENPSANEGGARRKSTSIDDEVGMPYKLLGRLTALSVAFGEVKVRIGQDVHAVPLKAARGRR